MSDPSREINVVAVVRADPKNGGFACVVRWMLGTADDLPREDDTFRVSLQPVNIDQTTEPPAITPAGQPIGYATVRPKRFFMIDPPRKQLPVDYPKAQNRQWLVAQKPDKAVDPADSDVNDRLGLPFGVCHLLKRTHPSSIAAHSAAVMQEAMMRIRRTIEASQLASDAVDSLLVDRSAAIDFAVAIVRAGFRAADLRRYATASYARVLEAWNSAPNTQSEEGETPLLLQSRHTDPVRRFTHALLVLRALQDDLTIAELERASDQPQEVRRHLRLRTLHGGNLIDFWCDPVSGGICQEETRGTALSGAEAIGVGCSIMLTGRQIDQLIAARLGLRAELTMQAWTPIAAGSATNSNLPIESGYPIELEVPGIPSSFGPGASPPIDYPSLQRAKQTGSSLPPPPPKGARLDYGMTQSNAAKPEPNATAHDPQYLTTQQGPQPTFKTGGGRIEIIIDGGSARASGSNLMLAGAESTFAFNVYGMWEVPETRRWFDHPDQNPSSAAEIRAWLMTRRYSYLRDLTGAFPDISGSIHPGLQQALSDPPWSPVLRRPTGVVDKLSAKPMNVAAQLDEPPDNRSFDQLPNPGQAGQALFAFDLRRGMGRDKVGQIRHWDVVAPANLDWTPKRDRDGNGVAAPQRYRFWVTAVDAFEQESAPVPVRAEDLEAGEATSYAFLPVWRTPILPPPGPETGSVFALSKIDDKLRVEFESPLVNDSAGASDPDYPTPTARVDASDLKARVIVFRRRITELLRSADRILALRHLANLPDSELPQWQRLLDKVGNEGWIVFVSGEGTRPTDSNRIWRFEAPLTAHDLDYDYQAAIGFYVADDSSQFWARNVIGVRSIMRYERDADGNYHPTSDQMSETPRASEPVTTSVLHVPNPQLSRPPKLPVPKMCDAAPILPPPDVLRDHLLLRILSRPFDRKPQEWLDTGVLLTAGQADMCETALRRCALPDQIVFDGRELRIARGLLARACVGDQRALRQHPTIGFRGLLDLQWQYLPAANDQEAQEANAIFFRVYGIRAPQNIDAGANFATMHGTGDRATDDARAPDVIYRFRPQKGDGEAWYTIADLDVPSGRARPTLARIIDPANLAADPIFCNVIKAGENAGQKTITVRYDNSALPANPIIQLFAAQVVAEIPVDETSPNRSYRHLLPVGGGDDECFGLWLTGVSALGRESSRARTDIIIRLFQGTIEPAPPSTLYIVPPTRPDSDYLDPNNNYQKKFMPPGLTLEDAKGLPRLIIAWTSTTSKSVNILVERKERRLGTPVEAVNILSGTVSPWAAIKGLEAAPDDKPLPAALVDAIKENWLMGQIVEVEGTAPSDAPHIGPELGLSGTEGAKILVIPDIAHGGRADDGRRPAFVDYFGARQIKQQIMDANWEFSYRLRTFRDLGTSAWRYLQSTPTQWSSWHLPETPPLKLRVGEMSRSDKSDLMRPSVTFNFLPAPTDRVSAFNNAVLAWGLSAERRWEYRVMVRRRLNVPMPSTGGPAPDPVWIDVGRPLRFAPGSTSPVPSLIDTELDRSYPGDEPHIEYQVAIQEFMIMTEDMKNNETLVRGFDRRQNSDSVQNFTVPLAKPAKSPDDYETDTAVTIYYS